MGAAVYLKLEKPVTGLDHIASVDGKAAGKDGISTEQALEYGVVDEVVKR